MFRKIRPYMGGYIRYTYAALGVMFAGLIAGFGSRHGIRDSNQVQNKRLL